MILMYCGKLLNLCREAYPNMDEEACIEVILKKIKKNGGGSAARMKPAFYQDHPVRIFSFTYERAKTFVEALVKKANKANAPKIFRFDVKHKNQNVEIFNMRENYYKKDKEENTIYEQLSLPELQDQEVIEKIKRAVSLAADALEMSNGNDIFLTTAKSLMREAKMMIGDCWTRKEWRKKKNVD